MWCDGALWRKIQERKFSPKRKFSAGHPCGHPAKNFGQPPQIQKKNKHFGTDIPRGRPWKNFGLKNFGLIFRFLKMVLFIDLLMGLFRGAVFRHGGGALKQPIKQPTETPTSTLALMGRFPSLMGRFPALMGRFTDFALRGRFTSWKSTGKQPIKKRGIKGFLSCETPLSHSTSGWRWPKSGSKATFPTLPGAKRHLKGSKVTQKWLLGLGNGPRSHGWVTFEPLQSASKRCHLHQNYFGIN